MNTISVSTRRFSRLSPAIVVATIATLCLAGLLYAASLAADTVPGAQAGPEEAVPQNVGGPGLAGSVTVSVSPGSKTVNDGATFSISVVCNAGSSRVDAAEVHLSFDKNYLSVQGITYGAALNFQMPGTGYDNNTGTVNYIAARLTDPASTVSGSFELFRLTFLAKQPVASTPLTLSGVHVLLAGNAHTVTINSGTVTILADTDTPTPSNTPIATQVPQPTRTNTPPAGVLELVLQQGLNGYTGFEDTFISDWEPTTNYYLAWNVELRSPHIKRTLIKADLSSLPPGTVIEEAILTLFSSEDSPLPVQAQVFKMLRFWEGKEVTWQRPQLGAVWSEPGANGVGSDRAGVPEYQRQIFPTVGSYEFYPFDFDVTALVQDWVNNPLTNQGLMITSDTLTASEFAFRSSEYNDIRYRPKLTIRYRQGPTFTPTPTVTGTLTDTPTPSVTPTATETPPAAKLYGWAFEDIDRNGSPGAGERMVQGVVLSLRRSGDPQFSRTQTTGPDGYYEFGGLDGGQYQLTVDNVPPPYKLLGSPLYVVVLVMGSEAEIDIPLERGSTVALPLIFQE
ncbi:MAG: DNRLRE domain-containing protein [Chloroflexi bacterium]|nr:DNRLRE domain-containing protein [Chloroflexota bacterium]